MDLFHNCRYEPRSNGYRLRGLDDVGCNSYIPCDAVFLEIDWSMTILVSVFHRDHQNKTSQVQILRNLVVVGNMTNFLKSQYLGVSHLTFEIVPSLCRIDDCIAEAAKKNRNLIGYYFKNNLIEQNILINTHKNETLTSKMFTVL
jgi:hypothetical protein